MEYINKSGKDVQVSVPMSDPVQWIVVKKGEKLDLPISERIAAMNGLYTEDRLKELAAEKKAAEESKVEAEGSSIGHKKIETKKVKVDEKEVKKKKKTSKKKSKK